MYLTQQTIEKLRDELDYIVRVRIPDLEEKAADDVQSIAEEGTNVFVDIENLRAEILERKLYIEGILKNADTMPNVKHSSVEVGAKVSLDIAGEIKDYLITEDIEADPTVNYLGVSSPLVQAISNIKVGDSVDFILNDGTLKVVKVLSIK